jgi:hypothetical protein
LPGSSPRLAGVGRGDWIERFHALGLGGSIGGGDCLLRLSDQAARSDDAISFDNAAVMRSSRVLMPASMRLPTRGTFRDKRRP